MLQCRFCRLCKATCSSGLSICVCGIYIATCNTVKNEPLHVTLNQYINGVSACCRYEGPLWTALAATARAVSIEEHNMAIRNVLPIEQYNRYVAVVQQQPATVIDTAAKKEG